MPNAPNGKSQTDRNNPRPSTSQQWQAAPQHNRDEGNGLQLFGQFFGAVTFPAGITANHHEEHDGRHDRCKHGVEVRWAHRQLAQIERVNDQWVQCAQQHSCRSCGEQDIVDQQERLARDQCERPSGAHFAGTRSE